MKIKLERMRKEVIEADFLPCPFCGHAPAFKYSTGLYGYGDDSNFAYVTCTNCDVKMVKEVPGMTEEEAFRSMAKRWNRRVNIDSE